MKIGDKVIVIIHGAGLTSEEEEYTIDEIDDKSLRLEESDKVFYKTKEEGKYITRMSSFGFWFEIKGDYRD